MMQRFDFENHNTEKPNHVIYIQKRQFPSVKGGSIKKDIRMKVFLIPQNTKNVTCKL